jgi:hypothetical protein
MATWNVGGRTGTLKTVLLNGSEAAGSVGYDGKDEDSPFVRV